jgi:hypothetical protein
MLADDALVVLLATLARSAVLEPVVAEVAEGFLRRRGVADAASDFFGLDLSLAELGWARL